MDVGGVKEIAAGKHDVRYRMTPFSRLAIPVGWRSSREVSAIVRVFRLSFLEVQAQSGQVLATVPSDIRGYARLRWSFQEVINKLVHHSWRCVALRSA